MKQLFLEFRAFVTKGSMLDMAVGIMIGGAFKGIVDSLVGDVISPLIGLFANTNFSNLVLNIGGVSVGYGAFLTALLNFLIMAAVLFFLLKAVNRARDLGGRLVNGKHPPEPEAPKTKICPYCKSEIPTDATRCGHCTSLLDSPSGAQQSSTLGGNHIG